MPPLKNPGWPTFLPGFLPSVTCDGRDREVIAHVGDGNGVPRKSQNFWNSDHCLV